ncbi:cell division protein FtsN [Lentilactobacillus fungorum]|uniref:Cell division protein FtsN n=1 Tax=Lentilactobacillus fungorum TaxID=2201250 RepID=A0ABQ3VYC9_9LACO|nr:type II toxin-antitoxin system PemK/MazF family toxin [Lentilactobacillus fungorum]GHP13403.1 cell division protein FtsN [Lentilactobacillus fungorum]
MANNSISNYNYHGYTPKQGDLVYLNFDPSIGREIKKRRPAIVVSSDIFNLRTGFVTICPITITIRDLPFFITLHGNKLHGQINASQLRTIDFMASERHIEFVETATSIDFMQTAKIIMDGLGFEGMINNL